jgi:hypothetical protein
MLDLLVVLISEVGVPPVVEAEAEGRRDDCQIGTNQHIVPCCDGDRREGAGVNHIVSCLDVMFPE